MEERERRGWSLRHPAFTASGRNDESQRKDSNGVATGRRRTRMGGIRKAAEEGVLITEQQSKLKRSNQVWDSVIEK